jgi:hypothetical protein
VAETSSRSEDVQEQEWHVVADRADIHLRGWYGELVNKWTWHMPYRTPIRIISRLHYAIMSIVQSQTAPTSRYTQAKMYCTRFHMNNRSTQCKRWAKKWLAQGQCCLRAYSEATIILCTFVYEGLRN